MSQKETELFRRAAETHIADREAIRRSILKPEREHSFVLPKRTISILVFAAILLVATTAFAAGAWIARENYHVEGYLLKTDAERHDASTGNPDIEQMIENAQLKDLGYHVWLLNECADYEEIDAVRLQMGAKPYDPAEWEWIRNIRPAIADVIRDGDELYFQTRLYSDHAEAFDLFRYYETGEGINLEAMPDDNEAYYLVEGDSKQHSLFVSGWGINPFGAEADHGLSFSECEVDDTFPREGVITVTQRLRLLDTSIEDMQKWSTVGVIEHTFSFDASAFLPAAEPRTLMVPLSGRYDADFADFDKPQQIKQIALDGVTLSLQAEYRPTGLYITVTTAELPEGFSDQAKRVLLNDGERDRNGAVSPGLYVTYTIDGQTYDAVLGTKGRDGAAVRVLPVFPSQYRELGSVQVDLYLHAGSAAAGTQEEHLATVTVPLG